MGGPALFKPINKNLEEQAQAIFREWFVDNPNPKWNRGKLNDLISIRYGKDHKNLVDGSIPVYGSGGIMRYVNKALYSKESILIPRKGTLNNVMYVNEPFWSVDTMFYTKMKREYVAKFVFFFVKSLNLASMNAGSAVPSMTTDILNRLEIIIPDDATLKKYDVIASSQFVQIASNQKESQNLSSLRNTLLPKLLSGKFEI